MQYWITPKAFKQIPSSYAYTQKNSFGSQPDKLCFGIFTIAHCENTENLKKKKKKKGLREEQYHTIGLYPEGLPHVIGDEIEAQID